MQTPGKQPAPQPEPGREHDEPEQPAQAPSQLLTTRHRHVAQKQLLTLMAAHKGWGGDSGRGKQAMSAAINHLLLLQELRLGGPADWGALALFDRLPDRVAERVARRCARQLRRLGDVHATLCGHFEQMRYASGQLRALRDELGNAAAAGGGEAAAEAPGGRLIYQVLTLGTAVDYAREMVAMYTKELVAKKLLLSALSEQLERSEQPETTEDAEVDGEPTTLGRDLGAVYVSAWMLQPMLPAARVDLIVTAFKSEVDDIGALHGSPLPVSRAYDNA